MNGAQYTRGMHPDAGAARELTDYTTLGRSGLRVSPFCLGTMNFGDDMPFGADAATSEAILARYLEAGGNFVDTANVYMQGHAEAILGDWFARNPGRRERAVIATKFYGNLHPGDPNGGGAGRKSIVAACNESLRRLRTDYIDLYWMHSWDPHTPIEETLRTLDDLVRAGKLRYLGFSDTPAWRVAQAQTLSTLRGWSPLIAVQCEYSLAERTVESELIPMAVELGLGVTPWGPLKSGLLTGKYTRADAASAKPDRGHFVTGAFNERVFAIVDELARIAAERDTTAGRVALAWLLRRTGVASVIVGARSLAQLEDNLGAGVVALPAEAVARLDQVSAPPPQWISLFDTLGPMQMHGGIRVNDLAPPLFPLAPQPGDKLY